MYVPLSSISFLVMLEIEPRASNTLKHPLCHWGTLAAQNQLGMLPVRDVFFFLVFFLTVFWLYTLKINIYSFAFCMYAHTPTWCLPESEVDTRAPETGDTDGWKPPCGYWERNPGLQKPNGLGNPPAHCCSEFGGLLACLLWDGGLNSGWLQFLL